MLREARCCNAPVAAGAATALLTLALSFDTKGFVHSGNLKINCTQHVLRDNVPKRYSVFV